MTKEQVIAAIIVKIGEDFQNPNSDLVTQLKNLYTTEDVKNIAIDNPSFKSALESTINAAESGDISSLNENLSNLKNSVNSNVNSTPDLNSESNSSSNDQTNQETSNTANNTSNPNTSPDNQNNQANANQDTNNSTTAANSTINSNTADNTLRAAIQSSDSQQQTVESETQNGNEDNYHFW